MRRYATPRQPRSVPGWIAFLLLLWSCLIVLPVTAAEAINPNAPGAQQAYKFGQGGVAMGAGPRVGAFLDRFKPADIIPGADRIGPPEGTPAIARAYTGDKLAGYVYLTTDIVNTRGYSSKPIDLLVGLAPDGTLLSARLVEHHEPIVLIGIPETKVQAFIDGYVGKNYIQEPPRAGAPPPVDMISGATVTLMVISDSLTRSVMAVGRHLGIGRENQAAPQTAAEKRVIDPSKDAIQSWDALLASGAVTRLHVTVDEVNHAFAESGHPGAADKPEPGNPDDTFIDLYMGLVSAPGIGRSLLGDSDYEYLRDRLQPGQQAILIAGNGYSFKGSGYVRGGIFDRIEIIQDENSFHFTDLDHTRMADLAAAGAPGFKEIALFAVPQDAVFNATEPWRLQLTVQRVLNVKEKAFTVFPLNYTLPQDYTRPDPNAPVAAPVPSTQAPLAAAENTADATPGTPLDEADAAPALWKQIWASKIPQIVIVSIALLTLIGIFFFQEQLTRHEVFYQRFRICFLLFSLFWIGWYAQAQLSVVNVLTFTTSLRTDFSWEYFLMDPVVFILWIATAMSLIFWNRGAFCGWLCPFGALQELTNKLARRLHVPQIKVPHGVNTRLAGLKYIIFLILFGISLYELGTAEQFAEVEPFKTAIILKFIRDWPFVIFAVVLLTAGLFIERFYCRYLCPLGAALAIPARLRLFDWLRRYKTCGNPCQLCAVECPVQAINPEGDINPNECVQCLNCQMLYHHETRCPHLIQKNAKLKRHKAPPPDASIPGEVIASRKPTVRPRDPSSEPQAVSSNP